ncbi:hypothetical protein KIW84_015118, partial [Lathyrus oleraceus]
VRELKQAHSLALLSSAITSIPSPFAPASVFLSRRLRFSAVQSWCLSAEMEQEAEQPVQIQGGSSDGSESDLVSRVRKLLFRRMLIGIKDGRFFLGNFYCIDKQGNIILQDTVEYRSTRRSAPSPMEQRCIGLILIPSSCRTSCHVDFSVDEQLSLLSLNEK